MNESTVRAERYDVQTAASPSYLWEAPQKPVSVRIPFSLIDRLEHEAVENFRSLTSRGSEIGGLLVGDVSAGNPMVVSIADYELIACDYSRGPLYRLSDADLGRFEQAIQQRLATGRGIAGFFRSHTRKGMSLDTDDLTFFQARFRDPQHIALLVRPFATKASTAGIFIWESGKINGEASPLEFPFRSSELGAGQTGEPSDPRPAAPPSNIAPSNTPQLNASQPNAAQPNRGSARAQIVPIASRREISLPPAPAAEPAPPPAPVASAPAPAAVVAPPAPAVEEKAAVVPEKPSKNDKAARSEKSDKSEKNDKGVKTEKAAKAEPPIAKVATPAPAPKVKTEVVPAVIPEIEVPEARSGKGLKLILAAAASIVLFVILFVYPGVLRTGSKPAPPVARQDTSQLQLHVERANGVLLLTWNRDAEAIRNASKAVLSISDGDQRENAEIDLAQLATGSIVYSPSGTDISFKMEVLDKAQKKTTSESVRMLRTRPSPLEEQADAAKAASATGAKPAPGTLAPAPAAAAAVEAVAEEPAKPVVPLKAFKSESLSQRLRPAAPSDLPEAPSVSANDRSASSAIPGVSMTPVAPAPFVSSPATPAAPAATPAAGGTPASGGAAKAGGQIQQAVLVYRKDAEYPKIAKQTGAKGAVTLDATIGADGLIKKVKVVSGHPMLTNAAAEAVKQWRYRPTLLNGEAVQSETRVVVNFLGER